MLLRLLKLAGLLLLLFIIFCLIGLIIEAICSRIAAGRRPAAAAARPVHNPSAPALAPPQSTRAAPPPLPEQVLQARPAAAAVAALPPPLPLAAHTSHATEHITDYPKCPFCRTRNRPGKAQTVFKTANGFRCIDGHRFTGKEH